MTLIFEAGVFELGIFGGGGLRGLGITAFTERAALDATTMTARTLGTLLISERSDLAATAFSVRVIGTTAYTERPSLGRGDILPPGEYPDDTPPEISNVHCNKLASTYIELDWDTSEPANCLVQYSTDPTMATYTSGPKHEHYISTNRSYTITGLTPNTMHYFKVISQDITGNGTISGKHQFKTADVGEAGNPPQPYVEP